MNFEVPILIRHSVFDILHLADWFEFRMMNAERRISKYPKILIRHSVFCIQMTDLNFEWWTLNAEVILKLVNAGFFFGFKSVTDTHLKHSVF